MNVTHRIETKINSSLQPTFLEVVNESSQHQVPAGSETHFKLIVVADAFANKSLIERHRIIYTLLAEDMRNPIHALALHLYTPEEWTAREHTHSASPPCQRKKEG